MDKLQHTGDINMHGFEFFAVASKCLASIYSVPLQTCLQTRMDCENILPGVTATPPNLQVRNIKMVACDIVLIAPLLQTTPIMLIGGKMHGSGAFTRQHFQSCLPRSSKIHEVLLTCCHFSKRHVKPLSTSWCETVR